MIKESEESEEEMEDEIPSEDIEELEGEDDFPSEE